LGWNVFSSVLNRHVYSELFLYSYFSNTHQCSSQPLHPYPIFLVERPWHSWLWDSSSWGQPLQELAMIFPCCWWADPFKELVVAVSFLSPRLSWLTWHLCDSVDYILRI
jgi:hypothetical protein